MDSSPVEISIDGTTIKAYDGEWLVDAITREKAFPQFAITPGWGRLRPAIPAWSM